MTAVVQGRFAPPVRVLLVDDDPTARRALREVVRVSGRVVIAAERSSALDVVGAYEATRPDVVVIDADMPGIDGLTATLRLTTRYPDVAVLVLAGEDDDELARLALRAGASGFVSKGLPADAIVRSMRSLGRGEATISRRRTLDLIREMRVTLDPRGTRPVESPLTTREWQVLDLMCAGASTEQLAGRLQVSVETVRSHVKHILRKLGAHTRREAIQIATRMREKGEAPARSTGGIDESELHERLVDLGLAHR